MKAFNQTFDVDSKGEGRLPERPAAVFLQVVLGSFALIRGQVKLCRR